jgi:hypothetical protein
MNRLFLLVTVLLTVTVFAQSPEMLSYQAVIRKSNNQLDTNATIGMKISILQGTTTGTPVYIETQVSESNQNGLVSIQIGDGFGILGTFSSINWANGPYFAKIETDPYGGTDYTITSVSQLLSVPYALFAKKAGSATEYDPTFHNSVAHGITASDTAYWNHKLNGGHYPGELFGGGVAFYVDHTGQHGLICAVAQAGEYQQWSNIIAGIGIPGQSDWDGQANSNAIMNQAGHTYSAAKNCADYINDDIGTGVYSDWYLPSFTELAKLYFALFEVNRALESDGNSATHALYKTLYWSSTEYNNLYAYYYDFHFGSAGYVGKENYLPALAIRKF